MTTECRGPIEGQDKPCVLAIGHEDDCTSSHFERVRRQEHKIAEEEAATAGFGPDIYKDGSA